MTINRITHLDKNYHLKLLDRNLLDLGYYHGAEMTPLGLLANCKGGKESPRARWLTEPLGEEDGKKQHCTPRIRSNTEYLCTL
jgi:hypothetical protein